MRIIHSLEGHTWSGGQQQALFLAEGQARMGHEVLLMCQKGSELENRAQKRGLNILPQDYRRELHPVSVYGLVKAFDRFRPDVVNVHRAWAHTQWALVSLIRRFPGFIVTRRVLFKPDFNPLSMIKYRSRGVRGYIAVSEAVAARLMEMHVSRNRIVIVHPGTDTDYFSPERVPNRIEKPHFPVPIYPNAPLVLFVGNYHRNKGHNIMLEAFQTVARRHKTAVLAFAGQRTNTGELRDLLEKTDLQQRVFLLGFRSDIPDLLSLASVAVNASFEEGFSGFVREALSMGVPVVASDIPANREISAKIPLNLFPAGSSSELADALFQALSAQPAHSQRTELRNRAIRCFSVPSMVESTVSAYQRLLK